MFFQAGQKREFVFKVLPIYIYIYIICAATEPDLGFLFIEKSTGIEIF